MIQKKEYHSGNPGKTLLVFGAIHGDEICGPKAIAEVMNEIDSGKIVLKSGKIIFVPVCNPEAFKQNKRFVNVNLNRVFKKHPNPTKYEEKLADILCDIMDDTDILLDIHSISSEWKPFVFQDYTDVETEKFTKILWIHDIVTGWPEMYAESTSSDTLGYGHLKWVIWAIIECGNHNNPEASLVAKKAILNALTHLEIVEGDIQEVTKTETTEAQFLVKKEKEGKLTKTWSHLDTLKQWEIIAIYDDGEIIVSQEDGCILLPFFDAPVWAEWFYFWKKKTETL